MRTTLLTLLAAAPALAACPVARRPPCRPPTVDLGRAVDAVLKSPAFAPLADAGFTVQATRLGECMPSSERDVALVHVEVASPPSASPAGITYQAAIDFRVRDSTAEVLDVADFRAFADHAAHVGELATRMEADPEVAAWLARFGPPSSATVDEPGAARPQCVRYEGRQDADSHGQSELTACGDRGVIDYLVEGLSDVGAEAAGLGALLAAEFPGCAPGWLHIDRANEGFGDAPWYAAADLIGPSCPASFYARRRPDGTWKLVPP